MKHPRTVEEHVAALVGWAVKRCLDCGRRLWPWQRKRVVYVPFANVTLHADCLRDPEVSVTHDSGVTMFTIDRPRRE